MSIWNKEFTLDSIKEIFKDTAVEHMGIVVTKIGEDTIEGEMPVDSRTRQIHGIIHGGSSVLFAETLGSMGGVMASKKGYTALGLDINANHISGVSSGTVVGVANAVHIGRSTQVWNIKIHHKETGKTVCVSRLTLAVLKDKE